MLLRTGTALLLLGLASIAQAQQQQQQQQPQQQQQQPLEQAARFDFITPCNRSDPALDKCLWRMFNNFRPFISAGVKDIGLPPMDPMVIKRLSFKNEAGAVNAELIFSDMLIKGAKDFQLKTIRPDLDNLVIELALSLPQIEAKGKYLVSGNVLLFPIESRGTFWTLFSGIDAVVKILGKEVRNKQNQRFLKVDRMMLDFQVADGKFNVNDTTRLRRTLGQVMNNLLNQHSREIINDVRPAASRSIARHLKKFLNAMLLQIPVDRILLEA